jgi:hypothetical protein
MQKTTTQVALKWGAITGLIVMILSSISFLFKMDTNTTYTTISSIVMYLIIPVTVLYLGMKEFKEANSGFMGYGQGLGIGAMTGGIAGVLSGIFTFFYLKFVDSTVMDRTRDVQMAKLEEQGLSSEQIEQSMEMMKMFSSPGVVMVATVFTFLLIYFVIALIVSAIQKNEKPVFE